MNAAQFILIFGIRIYRCAISPAKLFLFGVSSHCRFTPSCSVYALEAIGRRGAIRGSWLSIKRLCHCHPWGGCGHDPVPEKQRQPPHGPAKVGLPQPHGLHEPEAITARAILRQNNAPCRSCN